MTTTKTNTTNSTNSSSTTLKAKTITDCYTCYNYTNSKFCNVNNQVGYCCLSNDTSTNCTTNTTLGVQCSSTKNISGPLFYSYCVGNSPSDCGGLSSFTLTALPDKSTVNASDALYKTSSSKYEACYWHLEAQDFTYKSGAKLSVSFSKISDATVYIYGGNSQTNASINLTSGNTTISTNKSYEIDISAEMMIVMVPSSSKGTSSAIFSYYVDGTEYNWW